MVKSPSPEHGSSRVGRREELPEHLAAAGLAPTIRAHLHAHLRREPSAATVPGSLPVLFFGDLLAAQVVTVGINPSAWEYLDRAGRELDGPARRFETLRSLGAADRGSLSARQCDRAIGAMRGYYGAGRPVYGWFRSLSRLTRSMGLAYEAGQVAHLNLVQEATMPAWSELARTRPAEARALLSAGLPFLLWQLEAFPLRSVVCNGRTVFEHVCRLVQGRVLATGRLARVPWYVGSGAIGARELALAGWNIPLARPTGLGAEGERELGQTLGAQLRGLGLG